MTQIIIFTIFITAGYYFGSRAEKKHFKSIKDREKKLNHIPTVTANWKEYKRNSSSQFSDSKMLTGEVVVASDYFKNFVGTLRNLLGGRMKSYESLLDRARREARLRMLEKASSWGATEVINLRLETTNINSAGSRKNSMANIEVLCYGTALK